MANIKEGTPDSLGDRDLPQGNTDCVDEITFGTNDEKKKKKKEDRNTDYVMRMLNGLQTTEEKLQELCKKHAALLEENRQNKENFKQANKRLTVITREKEQLQTDHTKAVLAKNKLETLCRELQKQNKLTKDESLQRTKAEEEKRKEVSARFESTIKEIQTQMQDYYSKNNNLREENQTLAGKLQNFMEQYKQKEAHNEKVLQTKDLEVQLADAKLQQVTLQLEEEKKKGQLEKATLLEECSRYSKQSAALEEANKKLREQIEYYKVKYEEFNTTMSQSNDIFASYKAEMEKMSKKIKKMDKDTQNWKTKYENSSKAVLQLAEAKSNSDQEIQLYQEKISKLEKLCRALQAERAIYLKSPKVQSNSENEKPGGHVESQKVSSTLNETHSFPNFQSSDQEPDTVVDNGQSESDQHCDCASESEVPSLLADCPTLTSETTQLN